MEKGVKTWRGEFPLFAHGLKPRVGPWAELGHPYGRQLKLREILHLSVHKTREGDAAARVWE